MLFSVGFCSVRTPEAGPLIPAPTLRPLAALAVVSGASWFVLNQVGGGGERAKPTEVWDANNRVTVGRSMGYAAISLPAARRSRSSRVYLWTFGKMTYLAK